MSFNIFDCNDTVGTLERVRSFIKNVFVEINKILEVSQITDKKK